MLHDHQSNVTQQASLFPLNNQELSQIQLFDPVFRTLISPTDGRVNRLLDQSTDQLNFMNEEKQSQFLDSLNDCDEKNLDMINHSISQSINQSIHQLISQSSSQMKRCRSTSPSASNHSPMLITSLSEPDPILSTKQSNQFASTAPLLSRPVKVLSPIARHRTLRSISHSLSPPVNRSINQPASPPITIIHARSLPVTPLAAIKESSNEEDEDVKMSPMMPITRRSSSSSFKWPPVKSQTRDRSNDRFVEFELDERPQKRTRRS